MQVRSLIALSTLALAAGAAMAEQPYDAGASTTRQQVRQDVIDARANGQLRPAGEAYDGLPARSVSATGSALARSAVRHDVIEARANGRLQPAGEAADGLLPWTSQAATSTLARADVKAETLHARAAGQLIPAGEDVDGLAQVRAATGATHKGPFARLSRFMGTRG
ncbi:MAG: DUF4148 domain-containing protein [Caldimonas sp.]